MTWKFNASRNTNTQACRPRPQVRAAGQQRDAWTVGAGTWGEQGEGAGAQGPFRTTCATCFLAHPATAGRAPATVAGCGSSTRGLCVAGRDALSLILALLIWSIGIIASKLTAKIDPWATKVFLRSLLYQDFYSARERINTPKSILKRSRKI